ncbi:unnamed protein product [Peniophora sp. CBMAI 1063]|nr:unnamed protein product [Peniophora sp. CBMAI 1063]
MPDAPAVDDAKPVFRYLPSPEEQLLPRTHTTAWMPLLGDFVVFSIDPVASVAHLDKVARHAAKKIQTHRHVGLVIMVEGIPMDDVPVNAFNFAFLRKGLPRMAPPHSYPDLCIPVLPNTSHPSSYEALRPMHPLPWDDCYISATDELGFRTLRVKTTVRDYTPILPLFPEELWRVNTIVDDCDGLTEQRERRIQKGELEAIATIPLPESPTSSKHVPLPVLPNEGINSLHELGEGSSVYSSASSQEQQLTTLNPDDVSMIGSVDSSSSGDLPRHALKDVDIGFMQHFESLLNSGGSVDDPVVDIWYDLDMVKEVTDMSLFLDECDQIRRIIDDAEERLGIRAAKEAAAAQRETLLAERAKWLSERDARDRRNWSDRLSGILQSSLRLVICQSAVHDD